MVTGDQHQRHQVYFADVFGFQTFNNQVDFRIALHRPDTSREAAVGHHVIQAGISGEGVVSGAVTHKDHTLVGFQFRHLEVQGINQL